MIGARIKQARLLAGIHADRSLRTELIARKAISIDASRRSRNTRMARAFPRPSAVSATGERGVERAVDLL